ncbi:UNVERIFIED_CONTAM: hypothetical protein FKN15_077085 [Acipenser sinensis]
MFFGLVKGCVHDTQPLLSLRRFCTASAENLSKFIACVNAAGKDITRSRIHGLKSLHSRAASQVLRWSSRGSKQ